MERDVYCEKLSRKHSKATPPGEQLMQTLSLRVDVNFQTPMEVCCRPYDLNNNLNVIYCLSVEKFSYESNYSCKVGLK